MATVTSEQTVKGGAWLIEETDPATVMTPEKITDEHALIRQTATEFIDGEVVPVNERLEQKDWALAARADQEVRRARPARHQHSRRLRRRRSRQDRHAGRLRSARRTTRRSARSSARRPTSPSCRSTCSAPRRRSRSTCRAWSPAKWSAPTASANPAPAPTRSAPRPAPIKQADGSFVISGEKMWITNGGFADVYIIFAKVDGEHFTAFIVERKWAGRVERQGRAQARPARLVDDAGDPAGREGAGGCGAGRDRQGPQGRLQRAELRPLQAGRDVLGRRQDNRSKRRRSMRPRASSSASPIATFGAIKHKLGEMTAREYALESMMYRTAGLIDQRIAATPDKKAGDGTPMLLALEEFAVEASIAKVLGSETVDYVIDENLQIHGGNGFVHDYPAEGHYRDARVNRIFEGTNEINRLLIPGMLMKKAMKGELPLMAGGQGAAGRDHEPVDERARRFRRRARRRSARLRRVQEGRADGRRHRDAALRHQARTGAGSPELPRRHPDRHLRVRERGAARAGCRGPQAVERRAAPGCGAASR